MIVMASFSGIIVLALWLPSSGSIPIIIFSALFGFGSGEFDGSLDALISRIHPDDRAANLAQGKAAREGKKDYVSEYRVVWPDGSTGFFPGGNADKEVVLRKGEGREGRSGKTK